MNADNLLATSLVWDLLHYDYAWRGFQLPRVPSIFPDLLVQFAVTLATPDECGKLRRQQPTIESMEALAPRRFWRQSVELRL